MLGTRERLDVGEQLTEMIPVMVDPLVEQVADGQKPDLRVVAPALEVGGAETGDQGDAVPQEPGELVNERRGVASTVPPNPRDLVLIPRLERGSVVAREDDADPARRGPRRAGPRAPRGHRHHAVEQPDDLGRAQASGLGHENIIGDAARR